MLPLLAAAVGVAAAADATAPPASDASTALHPRCATAIPSPWPATAPARRQAIVQMENSRPGCLQHAAFLAALGALYVDDGQPETALLWLERALLLDPGLLGARGDHALALAALGERGALLDLLREWHQRGDVPEALMRRMQSAAGQGLLPWGGAVRLGRMPEVASRWGLSLEGLLLAGRESNLDQSPELDELTITVPGGDIVLPVTTEPRRGGALLGQALAVLSYSDRPEHLLQTGWSLGARNAPGEPQTDWQQLQWAAAWVYRQRSWRWRSEGSVAWVRGSLPDPHRIHRLGGDLEAGSGDCRWRVSAAWQARTRSETPQFDARLTNLALGVRCPLPGRRDWEWGLTQRHQVDRPVAETRPGGLQRTDTLGLRLAGAIGVRSRLQFDALLSQSRDSLGYSPLLVNDARRRTRLRALDVEWSLRLTGGGVAGTEWIVRAQWAQQGSNISLFAYDSNSVYSGLRWAW